MILDVDVSGRDALADWLETTLLCRGTRPLGTDAANALALSGELREASRQIDQAIL